MQWTRTPRRYGYSVCDMQREWFKMTDTQKRLDDKAAQEISPKPECERCGDLFYDPKTLIEDQRQRAAEWEAIAKANQAIIDKQQRALDIAKDALNGIKYNAPCYCLKPKHIKECIYRLAERELTAINEILK